MRYFIFPLVIGLMIIAALNLYMDPSGRWRKIDYAFSANWQANQVWVSPLRIEERNLRMRQMELLPEIGVLGLGSSRLYNVDEHMLLGNMHFYNASVSGATVWDYVALWEKAKQLGKTPKHLLIYVDTWNFNKNTWQKYRWISTLPLVLKFLDDAAIPDSERTPIKLSAFANFLSGYFYEVSDLFSPAVLKVSLQEIQSRLKNGEIRTNYISDTANRPSDFPAWKNDGSHLAPIQDEQPKTLSEITEIGRNIGMGGMYVYMKDWETDTTAIQLFSYLLSDAMNHGVDVLLVQPPFQHEAFDILATSTEYKDIPDRYTHIIDALLASHQNVAYCNTLNPQTSGCQATEFMDASHTLKGCAQKIVEHCLREVHWSAR